MHDDLGASLSKIALLSEVTLQNLNQPELAQAQMEKIVGIAGHATENMSELVWATNPKFDTRESRVAYLRAYAVRHFEGTAVRAELDFPSEVPAHPLDAQFRHSLFLVLKEALNNIEKHAQASDVRVSLGVIGARTASFGGSSDCVLELLIGDNGRGFTESEVRRFGNGLANMRRRVTSLVGTFDLQTALGQGTEIRITVEIPKRA